MLPPSRVTILGLNYAPEPTGNAPYTTALARRLADDAEVTVVTGFPHYPQWSRYADYRGIQDRSEDHGVDLRRVTHWIPNPPRGLRRLLSEISFGLHQMNVPWSSPEVAVLVSPALFASAMCALRLRFPRRIPHVVWIQDLYSHGMMETGEGTGLAVRIARTVERWLLRSADLVVTIHPHMAERVHRDLDVPATHIRVIPNWAHVERTPATRDQARERLGWSPGPRMVLHAGNMGRKQGLGTVVEAARLAHERGEDITFLMLGDGAERAALEEAAGDLPTIRFVDPLPADSFMDALAAADVLLVNELQGVKEMAAPSKLTSYFAAGRPVLAAVHPEGTVASILHAARAGAVVNNGDPAALLDGALGLLDDAPARERAGENATAYWRANLSEDAAIDAWRQALAQAVTSDRTADAPARRS